MDLALKMPLFGVLVFFCVAMAPSEAGDSCTANVIFEPPTLLRSKLTINTLLIPEIIITLIGKDTITTEVHVIIAVAGKSFIGGYMTITISAKLILAAQISWLPNGELILKVTECKVVLKSCKTNLPSSMLPKIVNKFLDSTLGKVLPGVLCPAADLMMVKLKESFYKILAKKPIGNIGYIVYEVAEKPVVYTTHISFVLKAGLPAGKKLKIKLTHREHPLVSVSSTGNTITTRIQASFLDVKSSKELLSILVVHECSVIIVIKQELLVFSLKAGSCRYTLSFLTNVTSSPDISEFNYDDRMMTMYKSIEPFTSEEMEKEMKKQCSAIKF
ncbi:BPI fold-containing family B member 6-like [Protobothrops mucrosquamatus]|uniref:BPI fold-containing family B member 6-like n=1 Tax=Protobothrops mucrosquamatus TaxID=103944 RepID=UPI0007758FF7|nr:BPI fold-containing family B member 6-like [Protobothrops mucrosquamatus]